jgi:hypothetical protein
MQKNQANKAANLFLKNIFYSFFILLTNKTTYDSCRQNKQPIFGGSVSFTTMVCALTIVVAAKTADTAGCRSTVVNGEKTARTAANFRIKNCSSHLQ